MYFVWVLSDAIDVEYSSYNYQAVIFDGVVGAWSSLVTVKTACSFNVTRFPFDKHVCLLHMTQWISQADEYNLGAYFIFSRRFSWKEPTIDMAFRQCSFQKNFDASEVTKIVLPQKFYKIFKETPNCTRWPKELNQKFPAWHTIPDETKGPPFSFFSAFFRHFFWGEFPPKGSVPPSIFSEFCDRKDFEKSQRDPLSVFSALWDFFEFFFHKRVSNSPILWYFEVLLLFWALDMAPTWAGADLFCAVVNPSRTCRKVFHVASMHAF